LPLIKKKLNGHNPLISRRCFLKVNSLPESVNYSVNRVNLLHFKPFKKKTKKFVIIVKILKTVKAQNMYNFKNMSSPLIRKIC